MARPWRTASLVVLLGAALGACGQVDPADGAAGSDSPATSSPTPSSPPSSGTAGTSATGGCRLDVTARGVGAAAGHTGLVLVLTNTGTSECSLTGYPAVTAHDASGAVLATARPTPSGYLGGAPDVPASPSQVTLPAAGEASALLEWATLPSDGATCAAVTQLRVTAPGTQQPVDVPLEATMCDPEVHPIVAGTTGGR